MNLNAGDGERATDQMRAAGCQPWQIARAARASAANDRAGPPRRRDLRAVPRPLRAATAGPGHGRRRAQRRVGAVRPAAVPAPRAGRDARRLRDRPRHRVVPQRHVPGYKSSAGMPRDLLDQFPIAEQAIEALGIALWPMVEFEADDAIAAAAGRLADDKQVERILICTPDKDMAQLVDDSRVVLWDRRRRTSSTTSRRPDEVGRPAGLDPRLARARSATRPTAIRACRAGARSPRPRCWPVYGSLEAIPQQASQVGGPEPARRARPRGHAPRPLGRGPALPRTRPLRTADDGVDIPQASPRSSSGRAPRARLGGVLRRVGASRAAGPTPPLAQRLAPGSATSHQPPLRPRSRDRGGPARRERGQRRGEAAQRESPERRVGGRATPTDRARCRTTGRRPSP